VDFGTYLLVGLLLSVITTVGFLALIAFLFVTLPPDYFCGPARPGFLADKHPVIRRTGCFLKNVLGAGLVVVGVVLSLPGIPGPGIVTILIGVMLLDFAAKRPLEIWLVRRPLVSRTINHLRRRFRKAPLEWR
jgi:hypothetical protein